MPGAALLPAPTHQAPQPCALAPRQTWLVLLLAAGSGAAAWLGPALLQAYWELQLPPASLPQVPLWQQLLQARHEMQPLRCWQAA